MEKNKDILVLFICPISDICVKLRTAPSDHCQNEDELLSLEHLSQSVEGG